MKDTSKGMIKLSRKDKSGIETLAQAIWARPESGYQEVFAACAQKTLLETFGFSVRKPYLGLKTAYRAEWEQGRSGPVFAFAAEYDALPDVGHACGHHLIAGTAIAAARMLQTVMLERKIAGRVVVLGCPAEELGGGKVRLADQGAMQDIDAIMLAHPIGEPVAIADGGAAGGIRATVTYHGHSRHTLNPRGARNPVDAQLFLHQAVGLARSYWPEGIAISGVMNDLGQAANQIPEIAGAEYVARGADIEKLAESRTLLRNLAKGAALLTGTRLTMRCRKGPLPTVPIDGLNDAYLAAMKRHGIENRREPEVTRRNSRKPKSLGMTDFGNFAQLKPGVHVYYPVLKTERCATHTKQFTEAANRPHAYKMMFLAATVLAEIGLAFMTDRNFRRRLAQEHARARSLDKETR